MTTPTLTRRTWLQRSATGFGALALHDLLQAAQSPLAVKSPRFPAKAKRVIFLFMSGGPSQPDLFDPKDYIRRMHGQKISAPVNTNELRVGTDKFLALATHGEVRPRGQSGMMISDLLPHTASIADEICLLRAVHADNNQHQPASLQFHTGVTADVRPSMGSWVSYGLGAENQNLPSFISIHPDSDTRLYGSSFLPAAHQGTKVVVPASDKQSPIDYLADISGDVKSQRARIDFTQRMNKRLLDQAGTDARMEGMIESMETAFRMQMTAPELVDLSNESEATKNLYGIGGKDTDKNARACLLARKLSEAGVRFVQVTMGGWDHHGDIRNALPKSCASSDQPCAALIKDLKSRGLLEDTLVVWSGEFGRTPWSQDLSGTSPIEKHGREHQPESFCTWMAGGGIRPGLTFGETDDFGFRPVSGKVHLHDLHATILHQLGLDHEKLTWRHLGRDFRLTDVYGNVVKEILA
ncbi:DUF1501 domain-containing protein [Prosthecobacter sp.]|uniref:DUF1501 domain-containing protein n=1 Tax=Prosthecobacter sp. TaxID=1965333 RepID=UPI003784BBE1